MSNEEQAAGAQAGPGYTSAADIAAPFGSIELPKAKDRAGKPVRVRFRKLDAADMALARAEWPGAFPEMTDAERERAKKRAKAMTPAEQAKSIAQFKSMATAVIVAACVEPKFVAGFEPKDGAAPIEALYDDDRSALFDAIMERSGMNEDESEGNGGATAAALGTFHGEQTEGGSARG